MGGAGLLSQLLRLPSADAAAASQQSQFRVTQDVQVHLGKKLELRCEVLLSPLASGCSWLFQRPGAATSPVFLMYISKIQTKPSERLDSKRISGQRIQNAVYSLTLNSFREEEQGYYFCAVLSNSILYFSSFVPVFLPGLGAEGSAPLGVGFGIHL